MEFGILEIFGHLTLTLTMLLVVTLIARAVVAGTKYSPILIIVVFGLALGMILEASGLATAGLKEFPMVGFTGGATIIALIAAFFVGGQKLRNTFWRPKLPKEDDVILNEEEIILGTKGTQLIFLIRSFFILIGILSIYRLIFPFQSDQLTWIQMTGALVLVLMLIRRKEFCYQKWCRS